MKSGNLTKNKMVKDVIIAPSSFRIVGECRYPRDLNISPVVLGSKGSQWEYVGLGGTLPVHHATLDTGTKYAINKLERLEPV